MLFVSFGVIPKAHATALLVCPAADGVVVSADSRGHSLKGQVEDYDKLQLVGGRVVVAEAGLLLVRDRHAVRFDVHAFVDAATRKLPRATAEEVARALARSALTLGPLTRHPSVTRAEHPQIILLVADLAEVRQVVIDLKPFAVHEEQRQGPMVEVGMGPAHLDPNGVAFDFVRKRRPELLAAGDGGTRRLDQAAELCGLLLTVEATLNPQVAPPIRQILLRASGVERRTFPAPILK